MTPKDIIPGKTYHNSYYPDNLYLGAQKESYQNKNPKYLVLINGDLAGQIVHAPKTVLQRDFWNCFIKDEKFLP